VTTLTSVLVVFAVLTASSLSAQDLHRVAEPLKLPQILCEGEVCYDTFSGEPFGPLQIDDDSHVGAHHDPWWMQAGFVACGAGVVADIATSLYAFGKHEGIIVEGNGRYAALQDKPIPFAMKRLAYGLAQCGGPYLLHRLDLDGRAGVLIRIASGSFLGVSTALVWKQAFDNEDVRRLVEKR